MKYTVYIYVILLVSIFIGSRQGKLFLGKLLLPTPNVYEQEYSNYSDAFNSEFLAVCDRLEIDPVWLKATILAESNWRARARNPYSGALGLIQFLPETLAALGSSPEALLGAAPIYQLGLIEKYYTPAIGRLSSEVDLRLFTFYPAALGKPNTYIIGNSITAKQNHIYDLDKDERITVGEFRRAVE